MKVHLLILAVILTFSLFFIVDGLYLTESANFDAAGSSLYDEDSNEADVEAGIDPRLIFIPGRGKRND